MTSHQPGPVHLHAGQQAWSGVQSVCLRCEENRSRACDHEVYNGCAPFVMVELIPTLLLVSVPVLTVSAP